jgi:16S rRNA (guanine(966)-N(2))-methyltransferase RsmD
LTKGEVRIIGGQWKRSKLPLAKVENLRPTPDRVRETLFNWLGQDLSGWHCADVFAGTGALGFEAASRGAAAVVLCESNSACVEAMSKSQAKLGATQMRIAGSTLRFSAVRQDAGRCPSLHQTQRLGVFGSWQSLD